MAEPNLFNFTFENATPGIAASLRDFFGAEGRVIILARTGPMLGTFVWGAYDSVGEAEARLEAAREACGPQVRIIDTDPPTRYDHILGLG